MEEREAEEKERVRWKEKREVEGCRGREPASCRENIPLKVCEIMQSLCHSPRDEALLQDSIIKQGQATLLVSMFCYLAWPRENAAWEPTVSERGPLSQLDVIWLILFLTTIPFNEVAVKRNAQKRPKILRVRGTSEAITLRTRNMKSCL